MKYSEAIEFIEAVTWKGSVPGLERITELCRLLGDPQKRIKLVHVAGTNGKGSVSAIVSSVLTAAGYKTGLFTSPHLIDYTERIRIDGRDITRRAFCDACAKVKKQAKKMSDAPTEFELLTAAAFVCFDTAACDVAVLECGMGGRLDATNVVPPPLVSVITNIALDHTSVLGDTEEKIAYEKAGIIKGSPVVLGAMSKEAEKVITDVCINKGSSVSHYSDANAENIEITKRGLSFTYCGREMSLPLCGDYQKVNLRTALTAVEELVKLGLDISTDDIALGVKAVKWKGRFEILCKSPTVIFDGAHNPDGAAYTAATYTELYPGCRAILVTGTMRDKDFCSVAKILSPIASEVFTVTPDNPRALPAAELAKVYASFGASSRPFGSVAEALEAASAASDKKRPVLCTGSLYMYKQAVDALKSLHKR